MTAPTIKMATQTMKHGYLERWTPEKVAAAPDPALAFSEYVQQTLGTPWPTMKDQAILRKRCNEFFEHYPRASWFTLCRVVVWCKRSRKYRRPTRVWVVVDAFRDAWSAGALPELDITVSDEELEDRITEALAVEERDSWRRRLIGAVGVEARRRAYEEWLESR